MASPPFGVNIAAPANTDIAANFPTLDRSDKDELQSWLQVLHNNQGRLFQANMDQIGTASGLGSAPTPPTNTGTIWYDSTGVWLEQRAPIGLTTQIGVPVGGMIVWPTGTAPQGWALCQGQSLSTGGNNALLFAVIGYTYGGSGPNFNLPDMRGRTAVGIDAGAGRMASNNTLAASGGQETITLGITNLPAHNHAVTITDPGHVHTALTSQAGGANFAALVSGTNGASQTDTGIASAVTNITASTAMVGSGTAFNNMPNYLALNWIIRVF